MAVKFCLPQSVVEKFKQGLRGELDPAKLVNMTTEQRRDAFSKYVGADAAIEVNKQFESKLLLVNRQQGIINWIKQVAGIDQAQRDALSQKVKNRYAEKRRRMLLPKEEEQFLGELVTDYYNRKLKADISLAEAKKITDLANRADEYRQKANDDGEFKTDEDRLKYGLAQVDYLDYIGELKLDARKLSVKEIAKSPAEITMRTAGAAKSIIASLDNSFFGRQGLKMMFADPKKWSSAFIKSFADFGRGIQGVDAMRAIRAEIYSRPNALNGKYHAGGGYDLGVNSEEEFPSSLPERIPVLGRFFKGSEHAFNGGALRLRADYADRLINLAEKNGVDVFDKQHAEAMAALSGAMTGRSGLGKYEVAAKEMNVLFFSVKFLKSNIDTLTAGMTNKKIRQSSFARKEAAKNLLRISAGIATILAIADLSDPNDERMSVEWDPRSSDFGKIKVGDTRFDVTGGMGSLVVLAARMTPTFHNGQLGFWRKSSTSGGYKASSADFGSTAAWDTFNDFWAGKLSPFASVPRDIWQGEMFGGKPATAGNLILGATTPIIAQNAMELMSNPNSAPTVLSLILDGLGIGSSTYPPEDKDWNQSKSKEINQFKEKVGQDTFDEANKRYNQEVSQRIDQIKKNDEYKKMSDDEKDSTLEKIREETKKSIFSDYNFKYQRDADNKVNEPSAKAKPSGSVKVAGIDNLPSISGGVNTRTARTPVIKNRTYTVAKQRYSWDDEQLAALDTLINNESGWNPQAQNPTSTAFGLFQFLDMHKTPGGYLPKGNSSTIEDQINGGLAYIRNRYGTPAQALAFWNSRSPHWY